MNTRTLLSAAELEELQRNCDTFRETWGSMPSGLVLGHMANVVLPRLWTELLYLRGYYEATEAERRILAAAPSEGNQA